MYQAKVGKLISFETNCMLAIRVHNTDGYFPLVMKCNSANVDEEALFNPKEIQRPSSWG